MKQPLPECKLEKVSTHLQPCKPADHSSFSVLSINSNDAFNASLPSDTSSNLSLPLISDEKAVHNIYVFKLLYWWLKFCSYGTPNRLWCVIMFLVIFGGVSLDYYSTVSNEHHIQDHIPEIAYLLSTVLIYGYFQKNLNQHQISCINCKNTLIIQEFKADKVVYIRYIVVGLGSLIIIRFIIFVPYFCSQSNNWDHYLGQTASFVVNIVTMYTLNFYICYKCLEIVGKAQKEVKKIERMKDFDKIHKKNIDDIENEIKSLQERWGCVVSWSMAYHFLYVIIVVFIWAFTPSDHLWGYCYGEWWTQLLVIIVRSIVRIYFLAYGILKLNGIDDMLRKALKNCKYDESTTPRVNRMREELKDFERFRVMCVEITWKRNVYAVVAQIVIVMVAAIWKQVLNDAMYI